MVQLGRQDKNYVEVTSGLAAGEVVETSGVYLLNSEYIFRNGADLMAGMDM